MSLHDGNLVELVMNVPESTLTLKFELPGESSRVATVLYSGVVSFSSSGRPEEGLASPGGYGDLGYDEVDLAEAGRFVHRILFSNGIEFEITFSSVGVQSTAA